ncbi:MAG: TIGR04086 family membrane protein [Firmicutes bacterium]|nr:TIGR04086 family membrane protein [Bacillota bacterium]
MNEHIKNNSIVKIGIKSMMVGLGTYFILTAVCVLVFWFSGMPESWMTYAGGACLAGGCFTAGIKMGSGIGKRGILTGLTAGVVLSLILWGAINLISGTDLFHSSSLVKFAVGIMCGTIGGMIGVNK